MIRDPELPYGYHPPKRWSIWEKASEPRVYSTVTIQCESFEEFRWWSGLNRKDYPSVMSHQSGLGPWFLTFAHGGYCCGGGEGTCIGWIPASGKPDYLCVICREKEEL